MNRRLALIGLVLAVLVAVGAWLYLRPGAERADGAPDPAAVAFDAGDGAAPTGDVVSVASGDAVAVPGATPMAERVAVIGFLNKRNGETRELTMKPGEARRIGDAVVRLRACEHTAPWEQEQYTGAFVQLDVRGADGRWRRTFSGWLFKERPALNVVQHPIYDVWPKSCTMRFPESGPETVSAPSTGGGGSSAKKSGGDAAGPAPAEPAASEPSAAANSTE
ncbi:hypothetical protein GGQ81_000121 [Sphingomonas desiccabilis]|nr:hypothetical protein [Sphingomonas desiccabilis]